MPARREENEISQLDTRPAYRGGGVGFPSISAKDLGAGTSGNRRRIASISQAAISGYFTVLDVPAEIVVGEDIIIQVGFYAINPGALIWSSYVVIDSPVLGLREVKNTRETGEIGGRTKTYNLGPMPDRSVDISFFLFAHEDVSLFSTYPWSWPEYDSWINGEGTVFSHLNSNYRSINPISAPPPGNDDGAELSGVITKVEPLEFAVGAPIDLSINFNAYADSIWEQTHGWDTRVTATLDGKSDSDVQFHNGRNGSRTGQTLNLGAMPGENLSGNIVLEGRGRNLLGFPTEWQTLDTKSLMVTSPDPDGNGEPPGNGDGGGNGGGGDPGGKSSVLPIALGVGAIAGAVWLSRKKKGKT